jgi:DNA-binding NtrC family response regulator
MKIPTPQLSAGAMGALAGHDFPGNVRELQNVLERACLLCCTPGQPASAAPLIGIEHLPRELLAKADPGPGPNGSALAASEKALVINALRANNWNQSKAARALGISRDNIRYRLKKYRIRKPE